MSNNDNIEFKKINEKLNIIYDNVLKNNIINNELSTHSLSFFIFIGISFISGLFSSTTSIINIYFTNNFSKKFKIFFTIFIMICILIFSIWVSIIYTSDRNQKNEINTGLEKIGIKIN